METPHLIVSRTVSACARCRNAKTKCDGKLPACSACEKAGKSDECSSANDEFAKGKERSYVASLESRIERLRKQLTECQHRRSPAQSHDEATQVLSAPVTAPKEEKRSQRNETSDVEDLVSDFGYLSVNATASGYHGFTQEMSFARLVLSTACVRDLPRLAMSMLPPRESAVSLVEDCVRKVFVLYPVLSEATIFGSLEAAYQHEGRYCPPQDCWNIRMVLAISFLCRSQIKGDAHYQNAVSHAAAALDQREAVLQPGSVGTVQSILLLVIYSMLDPSHFNCWYLVGLAARVMVDIGGHQEPPEETRTKPVQQRLRRRVFHCVYVLDRSITLTFLRGFSFSDDSVHVLLPTPCAPTSSTGMVGYFRPDSMDPAIELTRFRQIQSSVYQSLFLSRRSALAEPWQSRAALLNIVQDWVNALPETTPADLKEMILAEMFYVNILLLRPPGGDQTLGSYGTALFFNYAVGFAHNTWLMSDPSWGLSCCTNIDLLRILLAGTWFLDVLEDPRCTIFGSMEPNIPPIPQGASLPTLQRFSSNERISQAINAITQIDQATNTLGRKFGYPSSYHVFKTKSATVLQMLGSMTHAGISPPAVVNGLGTPDYEIQAAFPGGLLAAEWHENLGKGHYPAR